MAQYSCGICSGSGRAPCSYCGGSGKFQGGPPCSYCSGNGNTRCNNCGGTGKVGTPDPPSSSSSGSSSSSSSSSGRSYSGRTPNQKRADDEFANYENIFAEAVKYNNAGKLDKAIGKYTEAIASVKKIEGYIVNEPDDLKQSVNSHQMSLYFARGMTYANISEYDKAIADFNKAIQMADGHQQTDVGSVYYQRGKAYSNKEEYGKSVADYNKAISLTADNENRAEYYFGRGISYNKQGNTEKAISSFTKVISLSKDAENISHAYRWRGDQFYDKKEYDIAIADYTKAIKWGFGQNFAYHNRADCYRNRYWKGRGIADFSSFMDEVNNGSEEAQAKFAEFMNVLADVDNAPEDLQNYVSDLKAAADYGNTDSLELLNGYNIDYTPQEPEGYDGDIDEEDDYIDSKYFEDDIPYPAGQSGSPSSGGSSSDATYTAFEKSAFAAFLEKIGFENAPYGLGLGPILSVILGVLITVGVGFLLRAVFHSAPFLISVIVFVLAFASLRFTHKKLIVILSIIAAIGITISVLGRSGKLPAKTPATVEQVESGAEAEGGE